MRTADYIFHYLADCGVDHVFLVVGGGAMHLNDALSREPRIRYVCHHHEQGAAIAAEGFARAAGRLAVVSVTSGPGGTNALTGVIGQWLDSVPVLYLSGQVKFETTIASAPGSGLRQLGDQEINIVDIVRPVTKYAKMVTEPSRIRAELDRAIAAATTGRPGPAWLDVPLNVQGAPVDGLDLPVDRMADPAPEADDAVVDSVLEMLLRAERPLVVAGHGIRIAGAKGPFVDLVHGLGIPTVTTFNGFDLLPSEDESFVGRIGTLGSRAGNFALQNADLVLFLGTRNNIRQVSYNWTDFARRAKKVIVDIDEAELNKKTVRGDLRIHSDVGVFIEKLLERIPDRRRANDAWMQWCLERRKRYPVVLDEYRVDRPDAVHPYPFMEALTGAMDEGAVLVAGNGSACVVLFQAGIVKADQRIFWNSGCASMGYALPASIGAALGARREVVCVTGDGSLQMNLQELQTIARNDVPIKLFVLNNGGYRSIEQTQTVFFDGNFIGCNEPSGVSFPDHAKLADLYGFAYFQIASTADMGTTIAAVLAHPGRAMCEVVLTRDYIFAPRVSSERLSDGRIVSRPLEDLYPFLDRAEFTSNMICRGGE